MRSLVVALIVARTLAAASAFAAGQGIEPEPGAPFAVTAGGRAVAVQEISAPVVRLKGSDAQPYWYAQFNSSGPVEVRVKARAGVDRLQVLPKKAAIRTMRTGDDEVAFTLAPSCQVVVEPNGRHRALVIAANLPETDVPDAKDPNVVFVQPGRHRRNLKLASNQTLYLAPGAVLEGSVCGAGTNITIRGRGAISGLCWGHYKGPGGRMVHPGGFVHPGGHVVHLEGSQITVRDIVIVGAWSWCLVLDKTDCVLVDNVKILGGHVINDDAIDICRSSDVTIRNSFIRAQDDTIAPKWWCEDLLVEKCILWTDAANAFRVGYECLPENGRGFRNLVFRDIDVLHLSLHKTKPETFWANCAIYIQPSNATAFENLLFDDIRFDSVERSDIFLNIKTQSIVGTLTSSKEAGLLRGCTLRNIHIANPFDAETMRVHLEAADAAHPIEGVEFDDVTGYGRVSAVRTSAPSYANHYFIEALYAAGLRRETENHLVGCWGGVTHGPFHFDFAGIIPSSP